MWFSCVPYDSVWRSSRLSDVRGRRVAEILEDCLSIRHLERRFHTERTVSRPRLDYDDEASAKRVVPHRETCVYVSGFRCCGALVPVAILAPWNCLVRGHKIRGGFSAAFLLHHKRQRAGRFIPNAFEVRVWGGMWETMARRWETWDAQHTMNADAVEVRTFHRAHRGLSCPLTYVPVVILFRSVCDFSDSTALLLVCESIVAEWSIAGKNHVEQTVCECYWGGVLLFYHRLLTKVYLIW